MDTEIKLAYENNIEIKELFLEYTEMLVKNDLNFAQYLEFQNAEKPTINKLFSVRYWYS